MASLRATRNFTDLCDASRQAFLVKQKSVPADSITTIRNAGVVAVSDRSVPRHLRRDSEEFMDDDTDDEKAAKEKVFRMVHSIPIDEPDLVYTHLLMLNQCYEAMPSNNKVVVFTDNLNVRKAFYGLIYNSTRTGLILNTKSFQITGVLSVTDFIMVLMKLWKFRTAIQSLKGGESLTQEELERTDITNMPISKWSEHLKNDGRSRGFLNIDAEESLFHAAEMLHTFRIHRLPVMNRNSGDAMFILTHRRLLQFIWPYCKSLPKPGYMGQRINKLCVGRWDNIRCIDEDFTLIETLDLLINEGISGLPVLQAGTKKVVNVYTRFDASAIALNEKLSDLNVKVGEAIRERAKLSGRESVVTVNENVTMWELLETFVETNVHRIFAVDEQRNLQGLISLSDVITYMIIRPTLKNGMC